MLCSRCDQPTRTKSKYCRTHGLQYQRERAARLLQVCIEYKLKHGCKDCGYNKHHAGLEFDHIEPKTAAVSLYAGQGNEKAMWKEIAKCEVVCGTCHGIRTWQRRTEGRPIG